MRALFALLCAGASAATMPPSSHAGKGSAAAVEELLQRVLAPGITDASSAAHPFELKISPGCTAPAPTASRSKLCFELGPGSSPGKVALSGTSGVELTRGAAHYLRTRCNMSFAWPRTGGNQVMTVPKVWPSVESTETRYRTVEYSYFQNVVESSYSFAFYSWSDWQALIDWQALSGINLGLAYTGQEEVYRKTFETFGVNASAFANWTNGPAWLSWSRGQSMHGVGAGGAGSPGETVALTQSWMTSQWQLQKQILERMRALGIVPILPAFQGNVPPIISFELFPTANISVQGGGRHFAAWLDGTDPLFAKIADEYMKHLCADFGCEDHWYEADGYFAAGRPPWLAAEDQSHAGHFAQAQNTGAIGTGSAKDCCCHEKQCSLPAKPSCCHCCPSAPLDPTVVENAKLHATAAYTALNRTDPDAVWYYQGWILGGQFSYIKGLTEAVATRHLVISDMWCEGGHSSGIWKGDGDFSFFDAPFIWGVLHNFGGNVGMWGDVSSLNSGPFDAYENASSIGGVGVFPEGIDQNSPYYTFLFDVAWETAPFELQQWWSDYALQRYGKYDAGAEKAWSLLAQTVYGTTQEQKSMYGEKARDGITSYMWSGDEENVQPLWYDILLMSYYMIVC